MNDIRIAKDRYFVGYNDTEPPENLPPGYLADAVNCFCRTGAIEKRMGYTMVGSDLGSNACQGIKGVQFADGTKEVLGIFNGLIYKWTGSGSWASLSGSYTLATSGLIDIVVANNAVYFFDGTNTVPKYNATTVSTVAAIPLGKYARWFHNQMHVAGIAATPNRLKSSEIGDPETYTGGNSSSLDVNPNDGDIITGLSELNNELMVFKRNRVWSMSGFGTAALTLSNLNERLNSIGTLSHFSIVNTGKDLLYTGFLGDKPVIRSLQITRFGTILDDGIISTDIEGTLGGINKSKLDISSGIFDGRYAWFAFANSSSTYNNLAVTYDTQGVRDVNGKNRKGWTRHTGINAASFDSFAVGTQPQLYFGEASADSKGYVFDTSTSDNGTAISFSVTSRRYEGGNMDIRKKFKYLTVWAEESGDYNVTIDKSVDGFGFDNLGTLNLGGSGSVFDNIVLDVSRLGTTDVKRDRFEIPKSRNRYIQFKMYNSSATSTVTIRNWNLYYKLHRGILE